MAEVQSTEMHTDSNPNPPNVGHVTVIQRPDWVPEKFHDAKTGVINFEAMAKSYGELERSKSAPAPKEDEANQPPVDKATEKVVTPAQVPTIPGVDDAARKTYTEELTKSGKLSDTSYSALEKSGYSKEVVDAYIKGLSTDAVVKESVEAARIADSQITEITNSIGGKDALKEMQTWATNGGMTDKQLAAYNAAVSSQDVETVRLAVAGLKHSFVQANGTGENLLSGGNGGNEAGDIFESRREATNAINDPRYGTDPAYRARIAAKLGRSKVI